MATPTGPASGGPAMSAAPSPSLTELSGDATIDVESLLAGTLEESQANDEPHAENEEPEADPTAPEVIDPDEEPDTEETTPDEPEATEENAEDAELLKALKPKAVKRFNKLLAQRDEALAKIRDIERERDELQTKLTEDGNTPVPVNVSSDPLAAAVNEEQIEAHERHFEEVLRWCRRNPNGGTPPKHLTGGQDLDLDQDAVMDNLEEAEAMLKAIPRRRAFLTQFAQQTAEARKVLPEMFTKGTPANKVAQEIQRKLLAFHQQPDQTVLLAQLVKAQLMANEETAGIARYPRVPIEKAKATPAPTSAPKAVAMSKATVPPVRPTNAVITSVSQKLSESKGAIDLEDLLGV